MSKQANRHQGGREKQKTWVQMACWCTRGTARVAPTGNVIMLSSAPLKHPDGRACCSFFGEAVPGLVVVPRPKPEAPELALVSPFCSVSPHFSAAESLGLAGKSSPRLRHAEPLRGEGGCLVTCPAYTYFSLLIFLPKPVLAAPSSRSQPSPTPPICLR